MGPAVLVRAALILLIFSAAIATPTDADLWGHLAFGRDIVASGQPVQTDVYSFTTDRQWVNHEWLSEVAFFVAYRIGGPIGLIAFKLFLIGAVLSLVWLHLRRWVDRNTRSILLAATFVGTFWRTHNVRPQLFSVLLFTMLLLCLRSADSGRRSRLYFVPLIAAVWANVHGGWILGLAVYGLWAIARLADRDVSWRERLLPLAIGIVAVAATLLNPWGPQLWRFLSETVRPGRADIEEWSSITQYPLVLGVPWLLTVLLAAFAVWRGGLPERRDYLGIVAILSVLAFLVGRLDAFFVLAVVILLAPQFAKVWATRESARVAALQPGIALVTVVGILAVAVPVVRFAAPVLDLPSNHWPLGAGSAGVSIHRREWADRSHVDVVRLGRVCDLALRAGSAGLHGWAPRDGLFGGGHRRASTVLSWWHAGDFVRSGTESPVHLAASLFAGHRAIAGCRVDSHLRRPGVEDLGPSRRRYCPYKV